eukprot:1176285-Prorocentrum_minimum.AAC.1
MLIPCIVPGPQVRGAPGAGPERDLRGLCAGDAAHLRALPGSGPHRLLAAARRHQGANGKVPLRRARPGPGALPTVTLTLTLTLTLTALSKDPLLPTSLGRQ